MLKGNAAAKKLTGKINGLDVIYTDTYEIAVKNGFEGTIDEWLASLKGEKGDTGEASAVFVHFDNDTQKASMTASEIYEAHTSGKLVVLVDDDGFSYMPILIAETGAGFERVVVSEVGVSQVVVAVENEDNTTVLHSEYMVEREIDDTTESTEKTWSSKKIAREIKASASSVTIAYKNAIAEAEEAGFKKAVEAFCPEFSKSARLVQCYPLTAYPYGVNLYASDGEPVTGVVVVCGKNLYNKTAYPLKENQIIRHASGTYATSSTFSATEKYIPCEHLRGQTISIRHAPRITENNNNTGGGIAFYDSNQAYLSGANTSQVTVPDDASYMRFCINTKYAHEAQIELGDKSTEYEAYSEKQYADFVGMLGEVELREGCNTIYAMSDDCKVRVSCREDISALVGKLRNYI